MNAAEKQAWIDDLESGKYFHGKKRLKIVEAGLVSHCCLGVLVETLGAAILPMELECGDDHRGESKTEFNRIKDNGEEFGYEWFEKITGLTPGKIAVLYSINDGEETVGFKRQADWIRLNVVPK